MYSVYHKATSSTLKNQVYIFSLLSVFKNNWFKLILSLNKIDWKSCIDESSFLLEMIRSFCLLPIDFSSCSVSISIRFGSIFDSIYRDFFIRFNPICLSDFIWWWFVTRSAELRKSIYRFESTISLNQKIDSINRINESNFSFETNRLLYFASHRFFHLLRIDFSIRFESIYYPTPRFHMKWSIPISLCTLTRPTFKNLLIYFNRFFTWIENRFVKKIISTTRFFNLIWIDWNQYFESIRRINRLIEKRPFNHQTDFRLGIFREH